MTDNLLDPTVFDDPATALQFTNRHRCVCGGYLTVIHNIPGDKSEVICLKCGPRRQHEVITVATAERVKSNELAGVREMRPDRSPRSEKEILTELGF